MRELLVYPRPKEGQSVACYIECLARENGFPSPEVMMNKTLGLRKYDPDRLVLAQIQTLTGHDVEDVQRLELIVSDQHHQPTYHFGRLPIPSYHLKRDAWFCPDCVAEHRYVQAKWRISWLPVCLVHRRTLMRVDKAIWSDGQLIDLPDAANDDWVDDELLAILTLLDESLEREKQLSEPLPHHVSVVGRIDQQLKKSLRAPNFDRLLERRGRYTRRYFPLRDEQSQLFIECLQTQLSPD